MIWSRKKSMSQINLGSTADDVLLRAIKSVLEDFEAVCCHDAWDITGVQELSIYSCTIAGNKVIFYFETFEGIEIEGESELISKFVRKLNKKLKG
jgi:hypothetical protein